MTYTLKTKSLRAATLVAPTSIIRHYLNGVHITISSTTTIESTDGEVFYRDRYNTDSDDTQDLMDIIIPIDAAKIIAKSKTDTVAINQLPDGRYECCGQVFKYGDGMFPDGDRVIPKREHITETVQQFHYNYDLLALAQKVMRVSTDNKKAYYRLQMGQVAAMRPEDAEFPVVAVAALNERIAFTKQ